MDQNNSPPSLQDALHNMLAVFDTPLARLKFGKCWNDFVEEAVQSARDAVNGGNPLYAVSGTHQKCVHTEHCCAKNGCKYGEEDSCPVWLGYVKQSSEYWDGTESYPIPNIPTEIFQRRRNECPDSPFDP